MIERFVAKSDHEGGDGTLKVEAGQPVFAVKKGNLFFIWAYTDRDFAIHMDDKLGDGPKDEFDRRANWRDGLDALAFSNKTLADL